MSWMRKGGRRWMRGATVLCAGALVACPGDPRDDDDASSDGGLPPLIRGSLSCNAAEAIAPHREFDYDLTSLYDRSLLVSVTCGIDGDRSAASALFAPELVERAAGDEPDAINIECEVATVDTSHEFRFTPKLRDRTLDVLDNNVGWPAPATCTGTGDIR